MYRYVNYSDIDKNKWNGAVHYSPNGNVFGYHWYLKAALREWDAVVEDDYQSVMPVLTSPLHHEIYDLIPQLGPYSVNVLHSRRVKEMVDIALQHGGGALYPLNNKITNTHLKDHKISHRPFLSFLLNQPYELLSSRYDQALYNTIHGHSKDHLTFTSGMKPELLVGLTSYPSIKKNALMRIMYNALQRGIGFSNGIKLKEGDEFLAASFFISSHNKIFEIFSMPRPDRDARRLLMDLVIRNGAGKPMSICTYEETEVLEDLGFVKEFSYQLDASNPLSKLKKAIRMPY